MKKYGGVNVTQSSFACGMAARGRLFIKLHRVTLKAFPAYERFEFGAQLRRAAYSVAANIVEGLLSDDVVQEIENEIRAVSAPLVGLVRSTRTMVSAQIGAASLDGALVTWFFR